jgi:type II secretory pathway pseudopilin PulG
MTQPASGTPDRGRDERGFTLVEVLMAAVILIVGIGAAVTALGAPTRQSYSAQRLAQAAAIAEGDLEQIVARPNVNWSNICLNSMPGTDPSPADAGSANPSNPDAFVTTAGGEPAFAVQESYHDQGTYLTGLSGPERLVGCAPGVSGIAQTAPVPGGVQGTIYRFITYRTGQCVPNLGPTVQSSVQPLASLIGSLTNALTSKIGGGVNLWCSATNNNKRVTIAVVLSSVENGVGPSKPVYASTLAPNPSAGVLAVHMSA